MNLEELRSVQDAERRKSGLQPLRESFYAEAGEYIADLKAERERAAERADDPFSSTEVRQLSDEIETAEEVLEAIYDRRMGKLLKRASLSANDMTVDEEGLTNEEQELFHDLVSQITDNKERVLDTLAGKATDDASADAPASPAASDAGRSADGRSGDSRAENSSPAAGTDTTATRSDSTGGSGSNVDAASAMGSGEESSGPDHHEVDPDPAPGGDPIPPDSDGESPAVPGGDARGDGGTAQSVEADPASETPQVPDPGDRTGTDAGSSSASVDEDTERVTLRITSDVGPIYGVDDREYDLASEDVVTLPEANAQPLVERDAAEQLDYRD